MPRVSTLDAADTGLRIKGKARAGVPLTPPKTPKSPRPGKRDRRKRKVQPQGGSIIDLTGEDLPESPKLSRDVTQEYISFSGGESLASPGAGPSRQRSPAPAYTPTSFQPISRSILSGLASRPSPLPLSRPISPNKASASSANIIIDELPRPTSPVRSLRPDPAPPPDGVNEHFDPPGLFTTSLMPSVNPTSGQVELKEPERIRTDQDEAAERDKLLLPSHVLLDTVASALTNGPEAGGEAEGARRGGDSTMEGLHFLDDDVSKGVARYFDPSSPPHTAEATFLATADQSKICQNCKRPGHRMRDCPHTICMTCGAEDQHERRDCPMTLVCYACAGRGHRQADCPDPTSRSSRRQGCDRCGARDHLENSCPSLWRIYSYRSPEDRRALQNEKATAEGWAKEAIGGGPVEEWCYNCSKEGHLGDDCQQRRGSLARLYVPSAFSIAMSTRGPFANPGPSRSNAPPTHARWTDDAQLPYMSRGFEGAMAGKKTRDKDKRRLMDRERGTQDDDEDWFGGSRRSSGFSIRGRGTPYQKRPWDSDRRPGRSGDRLGKPDNMPFSHSHLMSPAPSTAPAKGISFGKLALPVDSPTMTKGRKLGGSAVPMVNRAIGTSISAGKALQQVDSPGASPTPGSTRKKTRRKRNEDKGRDWESEWRASGKGGGPVIGWGKDIDREERKAKVEAAKVSGQRYTGGY